MTNLQTKNFRELWDVTLVYIDENVIEAHKKIVICYLKLQNLIWGSRTPSVNCSKSREYHLKIKQINIRSGGKQGQGGKEDPAGSGYSKDIVDQMEKGYNKKSFTSGK